MLNSLVIAMGVGLSLLLFGKLSGRISTYYWVKTALIMVGIFLVSSSWISQKQIQPKMKPNTLIVGTSADFPPFSFLHNREIVGFDIDIANEVAKKMGKEILWENMPFDTLMSELQIGTLHMLAAGLTATPGRAQRVFFSEPYLKDVPLIAITLASQPPVTSLGDLNGKIVAVNSGYTADLYMSSIKGPILQHFPAPAEAFLAVKSGRVDAFVTAQNTVNPFLNAHADDKFNIFALPATDENNALAISKKYPELVSAVQKALDAMHKEGTIQALMKKWKII